jgi:tetratricopeptide (TPR) repeat protein
VTEAHALIGRQSELDALSAAIADAAERRGSVWLITGEAGIGKSRLIEEAAERAIDEGALTLFGRCWEAGGAPSFWPFIQALRALSRKGEALLRAVTAGGRGRYLQQLLPELVEATTSGEPPPALSPDQARFQLLDAVVSGLCDAAEVTPLVLILDDMHDADASSLAVLELLAGQVGAARIAVFATSRHAAPLARVGRAARTMALSRLGRDDVEAVLRAETGAEPPTGAADTLHHWTEGNPLFLVETARWLVAHGELGRLGDATRPALPSTVMAAITERLSVLAPSTRDMLAAASVLGREVDALTLAAVCETGAEGIAAALGDAVDAAVMHHTAIGGFRFGHILIREAIYETLPAPHRAALHGRVGAVLEAANADASVVAHHWSLGGDAHRDRASRAHERAAEVALSQLALEEAAACYEKALSLSGDDARRAVELALGLGRAAMLAGDAERCKDACLRALELARALDDAELMARAALTRGGIFTYGVIDPDLVGALEDSLSALGDEDGQLQARVRARLAAALQPAHDPEIPFQMARDAIAMARRVGDDRTLLDTLRSGGSALMDLADPRERLALNTEHVALATRLGDAVEALRGHMRICFDAWELGDDRAANAAVEACDRLATELDHPFHRWRATSLLCTRAMRAGRFRDAERLWEDAQKESRSARDPNARVSLVCQRYCLLRSQGRFAEAIHQLPMIAEISVGIGFEDLMSTCFVAGELARMGRLDEARDRFDPELAKRALIFNDLSMIAAVAVGAARLGLLPLCEAAYEVARPHAGRFVSWGIMGMAVEGTMDEALGVLAAALQKSAEAESHFERAAELARNAGALPFVAWARLEHARCLVEAGGELDARVDALLREAESLARELGMPAVLEIAERVRQPRAGVLASASARTTPLTIEREGSTWTIRKDGRAVHLEDARGMQMLAQLVAEPGREVHVLDLSGRPDPGEVRDDGDAGELIDARARAEYRRRIVELREELDEAESWNDSGRAERAREELSFLEAELARAVGLGGRPRRAKGDAERARVNVQRRLKHAIRRIEAQDPELGAHLTKAVRTGTFCAYES